MEEGRDSGSGRGWSEEESEMEGWMNWKLGTYESGRSVNIEIVTMTNLIESWHGMYFFTCILNSFNILMTFGDSLFLYKVQDIRPINI